MTDTGMEAMMREAVAAVQQHGSKAAAARALGIPVSTLKDRYRAAEDMGLVQDDEDGEPQRPSWRETRERDVWVFECSDARITNEADAMAKVGADPAIWRVKSITVNGWDVTMKLKRGDEEQPYRSQNQQVKVVLERRVSAPIEEASKALLERFSNAAPKFPRITYKPSADPVLYEVSLYDAHFGKLCWAEETGQDYDLKIAERLYAHAVADLLQRAAGYNIERFLFPIGQDFFHTDNFAGVTPKSGNILDVDGRLAKIIDIGTSAVVQAIELCLCTAPVDVVWMPGNHDPVNSMWLAKFVKAYFRHCEHVTVDDRPLPRKAIRYGKTLIAMHHGDNESKRDMPAIIMAENRDLMPGIENIEIHGGHWHTKAKTYFDSVETLRGDVVYRTLPSLSGRDAWHAQKGYGTMQAAEGYLYDHEGPLGSFCVRARMTPKTVNDN